MENNNHSGYTPYQKSDPDRTWYYIPCATNPEKPNENLLTASYSENPNSFPHYDLNIIPSHFSQNSELLDSKTMIKQLSTSTHVLVDNEAEFFNNIDVLPNRGYFCRVCTKTYKSSTTVNSHIRLHHIFNESICTEPGCDHVAYTTYERRKHQKLHDKMNDRKSKFKRTYDYELASLPMPSEKLLKEQILKSNKDIEGMIKSMDDSEKGKMSYTCTICKSVFQNSFHATRHAEAHLQNPRKCFYCGDILKGNVDLRVHYLKIHKDEGTRTFACSGCYKEFTSLEMYREHQRYKTVDNLCRKRPYIQNVYYGDLPNWVAADPVTQKKIDGIKRKFRVGNDEINEKCRENEKLEGQSILPPGLSPVFVQTEFGLKHFEDLAKNSITYRPRSEKTCLDENSYGTGENVSSIKMSNISHPYQNVPFNHNYETFQPNYYWGHSEINQRATEMTEYSPGTNNFGQSSPITSPDINIPPNVLLDLNDGVEYNGISEISTQSMLFNGFSNGFGGFADNEYGMPSTSEPAMLSDSNNLTHIF